MRRKNSILLAEGPLLIHSLWQSRYLLLNLVRRDLTVRYKSTALGFFWSFAKPLAYMAIYHFVFGRVLALEIREARVPYALHVLAGILPWSFFAGASAEALQSILGGANLIKKVKLPLEVFPLAAVVSHAIHFALAMMVVVVGMILYGLPPGPGILLLPILFAIQFIMVYAVALLLASLNVFYRDVASIWEVGTAAWFYATPIIYPIYYATEYLSQQGMDWAHWLYLANPMTPLVVAYRRVMLYGAIENPTLEFASDGELAVSLALVAILSTLFLVFAHRVFMRLSRRFADQL